MRLTMLLLFVPVHLIASAHAQTTTAQLQGRLLDKETGAPLPAVTVVVDGPALPGMLSEITDSQGRFVIGQLPPGEEYVLRFYYGEGALPRAERRGLRLSSGKTLTIDTQLQLRGSGSVRRIHEPAPDLDTASPQIGAELPAEFLRGIPLRGRTYESSVALAPSTVDILSALLRGGGGLPDEIGASITGATGNENNYLIDGLNSTDPGYGLLGTALSPYLIKEVQVISGGMQAEYGRLMGGVVAVTTKGGSDEYHGGVYGSWQPLQLRPAALSRIGEPVAVRTGGGGSVGDIGFDLGGPLIAKRLWFYVGMVGIFQRTPIERSIRSRVVDPASGSPQLATSYACPDYLATPVLCKPLYGLASEQIPTATVDTYLERRDQYNAIGKLELHLHRDHHLTLTYIAAPESLTTYDNVVGAAVPQGEYGQLRQVHDLMLRYTGKALRNRLQLDVVYGLHLQRTMLRPRYAELNPIRYQASQENPYSLFDFEAVPECQQQRIGDTLSNPCPVTDYTFGFRRYERELVLHRHQLQAMLSYFWHRFGLHAIKAGVDFEHLISDSQAVYPGTLYDPADPLSGRKSYRSSGDGSRLRLERAEVRKTGPEFAQYELVDDLHTVTQTENAALFLRDSWIVGGVPGLVVNLGLRWELQQVSSGYGTIALAIWDNLSPRLSVLYDFTQHTRRPGSGKVFLHYGRYNLPLTISFNTTMLSGEYLAVGRADGYAPDCPLIPRAPGARPLPRVSPACSFPAARGAGGAADVFILPGTKGQSMDEVLIGASYDVGWGFVIGASYLYRGLGRIIEDFSLDGGEHFFVGNPGQAYDSEVLAALERDATALEELAKNTGPEDAAKKGSADTAAQQARARASTARATVLLPRPRRDYHALTLTVQRRLSQRLGLVASYTYSRTLGNYPGSYASGQLNPNISTQYDIVDLLVNRDGPLPSDRPHQAKLAAIYQQPLGQRSGLLVGLSLSAISGTPISVLGANTLYGRRQTFILPRGSGGRTPFFSQVDLHLEYEHRIGTHTINPYVEILNLFDQRTPLGVDQEYVISAVNPILHGRPEDLPRLLTSNNRAVQYNPNYGQPTSLQRPLYLRLGARITF